MPSKSGFTYSRLPYGAGDSELIKQRLLGNRKKFIEPTARLQSQIGSDIVACLVDSSSGSAGPPATWVYYLADLDGVLGSIGPVGVNPNLRISTLKYNAFANGTIVLLNVALATPQIETPEKPQTGA